MTSLKIPYVSPFPVQCVHCGEDMTEGMMTENKIFRHSHRILTIECEECASETKIKQVPLSPDFEYVED